MECSDETVAPYSAQQFQPPSGSCPARIVATALSTSWPKYAPAVTTTPLMQGSVSPLK